MTHPPEPLNETLSLISLDPSKPKDPPSELPKGSQCSPQTKDKTYFLLKRSPKSSKDIKITGKITMSIGPESTPKSTTSVTKISWACKNSWTRTTSQEPDVSWVKTFQKSKKYTHFPDFSFLTFTLTTKLYLRLQSDQWNSWEKGLKALSTLTRLSWIRR